MKILLTSGGTKVPIDDVRYIGNMSSGRYGAEIAEDILKSNHELFFFYEKGSKQPDIPEKRNVRIHNLSYKDYFDYLYVKDIIKNWQPDIIISAAAVSDYIVDKQDGKISSSDETMTLTFRKAEKVIASFRELAPNAKIIGFKLLVEPTHEELHKAVDKLYDVGVDMVVYNNLTSIRNGYTERFVYRKDWKNDPYVAESVFDLMSILGIY